MRPCPRNHLLLIPLLGGTLFTIQSIIWAQEPIATAPKEKSAEHTDAPSAEIALAKCLLALAKEKDLASRQILQKQASDLVSQMWLEELRKASPASSENKVPAFVEQNQFSGQQLKFDPYGILLRARLAKLGGVVTKEERKRILLEAREIARTLASSAALPSLPRTPEQNIKPEANSLKSVTKKGAPKESLTK